LIKRQLSGDGLGLGAPATVTFSVMLLAANMLINNVRVVVLSLPLPFCIEYMYSGIEARIREPCPSQQVLWLFGESGLPSMFA
jgi:hypothetical protein